MAYFVDCSIKECNLYEGNKNVGRKLPKCRKENMSILHLVEVSRNMSSYSAVLNQKKNVYRIKRNESKLPKMSKEYRNEFRKDTIGENVSQGNGFENDFRIDGH